MRPLICSDTYTTETRCNQSTYARRHNDNFTQLLCRRCIIYTMYWNGPAANNRQEQWEEDWLLTSVVTRQLPSHHPILVATMWGSRRHKSVLKVYFDLPHCSWTPQIASECDRPLLCKSTHLHKLITSELCECGKRKPQIIRHTVDSCPNTRLDTDSWSPQASSGRWRCSRAVLNTTATKALGK